MKVTIDTRDIARKTGEIIKEAMDAIRDEREKVALDIFGDLIQATPVDTGHARQGWQIEETPAEMAIINNVEYIGALNNGLSKQAPAGFIETIVDKHTR